MSRAGFVLVGGRSSRMGHDKAFLEIDGSPLVVRAAEAVREAAGSLSLVDAPGRREWAGFSVIYDTRENCGPLAGIEAALLHTHADWNLIVACDMPALAPAVLRGLFEDAEGDCVVPRDPSGKAHPLCAIYHQQAGPKITRLLDAGVRRVMEAIRSLDAHFRRVDDPSYLQNVNTPEEWERYLSAR